MGWRENLNREVEALDSDEVVEHEPSEKVVTLVTKMEPLKYQPKKQKCGQCKSLVPFPCKHPEHIGPVTFRRCEIRNCGRYPMQASCESFLINHELKE